MISATISTGECLLKEMRLETAVVRILVVDDFEAWRQYVRSTLQQNSQFKVIGEGADGEEAVQRAKETQPDLVLLDLALPKLNGIAALRGIRESSPKSKVLLMSVEQSPEVVDEALRSGAAGYVVKNDAANDLLLALEAILQNRRFVSRSVNGKDPSETAHDFRMNVEAPSLPAEFSAARKPQ
jgi:DNA-binding NarL/FixJ family response regulator